MRLATLRTVALGLALGLPATAASAKSVDDKTAWGAAAAVAGVGAILEAKDNPTTAALLAAGAVYSYTRYDKARRDDRDDRYDDDPYGYSRGPAWRPGKGDVRYNSRTREVSGFVTRDTGVFDRKIRIRLDDGRDRTLDVPKDARVLRNGRAISIHDVKKDDYVRARLERYRDDGDLEPVRVEVLGRYDGRGDDDWRDGDWRDDDRRDDDRRDNRWDRDMPRDETRGSVDSIDSRNGVLRIRVNGRVVRADVRGAEIRDRRGSMSLRDLQDGDRVTVYGRRDGDTIRATRVYAES